MTIRTDAAELVAYLNQLLELDRPAIAALVANRVPCNEDLGLHPTVQVGYQHGSYHVGLLGVLNGYLGVHDNGRGALAAVFLEDGGPEATGATLARFELQGTGAAAQEPLHDGRPHV